MNPTSRFPSLRLAEFTREAGFTLMELMVGMTIGMIATIIIVQVMSVFEAQKRSTTGTADAQTNGGIALYSIAREAQMAGYPLFPGTDTALSCTTITYGGTGIGDVSPVSITEAAAVAGVSAASDRITIRYGDPTTTTALPGATPGVQTQIGLKIAGTTWTVGSNLGCQIGDATMINSGTTCAMSKVTGVSAAGVSPITVTLANDLGAASGANIACLGPWNEVTYAVDFTTGNLVRTRVVNGVADANTTSVVGVVNLQAQYGISSASNSNQITGWVDASGGTWAAPTVANRNRIKAIRIAVVARNAKKETSDVSSDCTSLTATPTGGLCAWDGSLFQAPAILLSPYDPDWKRYRYRVFETTIPLRNVIWSKSTL